LSPLLILAIARFTLREKVPPAVWSVTFAACVGAALLTGVHSFPHLRQLVFPLGMGLSFGLYVVMTRSLQTESLRANLFYTALGVFLALTPVIPHLWVTPGLHDAAILVSVGVLGFLVLLALDRAASLAPVSQSAAATCAQVGFVALLAWGFGKIVPSAWMLVGLAVLGVALATLWARNPERAMQEVA
jgi:drug/metabolite transporter (DMT)-like permease